MIVGFDGTEDGIAAVNRGLLGATVAQQPDLIGSHAEVLESSDPNKVGIKGEIVDETHSTVTIMGEKTWILPKQECTFQIDDQEIKGPDIIGAPKDKNK